MVRAETSSRACSADEDQEKKMYFQDEQFLFFFIIQIMY